MLGQVSSDLLVNWRYDTYNSIKWFSSKNVFWKKIEFKVHYKKKSNRKETMKIAVIKGYGYQARTSNKYSWRTVTRKAKYEKW